ncbi:MAG TPA: hypothetical protein VF082_12015 [Jiangellaceae bacterium]
MEPPPDAIFRGAFRRSTLIRNAVTDHELRAPSWRHVHHNRYAWSGTDPEAPAQRILEAVSLLTEGCVLGGWAAAFLHGATDLDGRNWFGRLEPVLFVLPYERRIRRAGIRPIRAPLAPADVVEIGGVQVTAPLRTCFDLMRLRTVEDAVVAADAMLRAEVVTVEAVTEYVHRHAGWRGVGTARAAVHLADGAAASCPESRLRVLWVVDAGLPRPAVNRPVFNPDGVLLGVPDLLDEESGLVGEYDGAVHRDARRHAADNVREERLESHGLTVVRATAIDLQHNRARLAQRLRDGHRRAAARNRRLDRWTADPAEAPWFV